MKFSDVDLTITKTWSSVVITPQEAEAIIDAMPLQRKPTGTALETLIADVEAGTFQYVPGNAIHFDLSRLLANGQHRCLACALGGNSITVDVVTMATPEQIKALDLGVSRKTKDIMDMRDSNPNINENIAKIGKALFMFDATQSIVAAVTPKRVATKTQELEYITDHHEELLTAATFVCRPRTGVKPLRSKQVEGLMFVLFNRVDPEYAVGFFESLENGAGLDESNQIHQLRERLMLCHTSDKKQNKLTTLEIANLLIRAWEGSRNGSTKRLTLGNVIPSITGLKFASNSKLVATPHNSDIKDKVNKLLNVERKTTKTMTAS